MHAQMSSPKLPEGEYHEEGEEAHEEVADGEDVGGHGERHVSLHQHPQLHGEGEAVEEGGHDGDGEAAGEEGAAEAGGEDGHAGEWRCSAQMCQQQCHCQLQLTFHSHHSV